ncbi:hypothetical protein [Halanaeroarchaeum sulfurireducens]|uniref:Uncharacterized protein n=1 Tax=Halanaeroarchaeum sulfurireducens TaxID=1604004 RepID=A0A0F7PEI1_9EURY|nr:hypothetical protein [Halanaeroarchaeum sulfurireducens]AKH98630.1 hypothetical protein HLASF_3004 [Halanaeroarchaeum sulfurireducens]ALG83072.1 hypothetical protein HLASA_3004 [Halanaeroarchaeum sulfurireducens]
MTIDELFHSDPTRQLEEVQKINSREQAETDVREFYETDSAEQVLKELGEVVQTHPSEAARFLYIHATFGSGKTHLLKLVGLLTDAESDIAYLGDRLAEQWPGFDELQRSISDSHVDGLKPVFLNLLDRDASKEPPLPFLIFEAIGRELGYPTDPNWLLEWAWTVDMQYDGIWEGLEEIKHDGKTFDDVLAERASLRSWLYEALPAMPETSGTDFDSRSGVKASIEAAEADVEPKAFDPDGLVSRVETAIDAMNDGEKQTELLVGLDEVALFVGDSRHRYREFEETMEALQRGPNPVVVTTGQYSLPDTRESLIGEPPENHWTRQQVPLEGADTEIIVRKRWLQKSDPEGTERVQSLVESMADFSLHTYSSVTSSDPDPIESYPFREYDLSLLRAVMQGLITQGRSTDRDYIQGRALLVLVRSLFTKFGWASKEEGSLVTWDVLFDLLVEETTYLPLWVQEMIDNTLVPTFDGDEDAWEVRLAKGLYLLNQTPAVPSTPENLGRLMADDVTASVDEVVERTESGLETLVDKQKVLTETNDEGDEVYTLVSEDQESILSRAQDKAAKISPHQLSAWLETRLRENDDFFHSDNNRHEVDVGDERLVPLRYNYSILEPVDRAPTPEYDALRVRVLADDHDTVTEQVETWQEVNDSPDGEHILITIDVPETMLERIRNVIGMGKVLDEETESHPELEREHRTDKRRLESSVTEILEEASVFTAHEHRGTRSSVLADVVKDQVDTVFGSSRKTLTRPLVEVDDAKAVARFFRGSGEWPLSDADAAMLGVDTASAEIADTGWCREFIETYESQKSVDVETLLQQTRTADGDYRGTPQKSIAALLITLATSNEDVVLKRDTDYLNDPTTIGRQVRTKGGLSSLTIRFEKILDPRKVRSLVATVSNEEPIGDGIDEWLNELEVWIEENSATVKRTLKGTNREFGVTLDAFEATIDPALRGEELSTSDLGSEDDLETVLKEANTFADARELFGVEEDGGTIWERFSEELDTMTSLYPNASITNSMRSTAESNTVPSVATVESRIRDAEEHRVDEISEQYRRITGNTTTESDPEAICDDLSVWLQSNEDDVREIIEKATAEFKAIVLDDLIDVFEKVWNSGDLSESDVANPAVVQRSETYEQVRELLDDTGGASHWSQLQEAGRELREEHPESPTTEAVETALDASRPPTKRSVRQLIERAKDPKLPGADDDAWAELQGVAEELRQELPNADVTDDVTEAVDADERPSEEQVNDLLAESKTVLDRIRDVEERLDGLKEGSIVVIEE